MIRLFIFTALIMSTFVPVAQADTSDASESALALQKIAASLAKTPNDLTLLKSHAEISTWDGKYKRAIASYQKILTVQPTNDGIILALANVEAWGGRLDDSAAHFEDYISRHGDNTDALLSYANIQSWRGDSADAIELIERYKDAGGDAQEYNKAITRFYAGSGFSNTALTMADETLRSDPHNYHAQFSRTLALRGGQRLSDAQLNMDALEHIPGDEKSKADLRRMVALPLRSHIRTAARYSWDSDQISIAALSTEGRYMVNHGLYIRAGAQSGYLRAARSTGLETINGNDRVRDVSGWIAADYEATDDLWLHGRTGRHDTNVTDSMGTYRFEVAYRPLDQFSFRASVDRDFHAVSPRAVSLDIARTERFLRTIWRPDLKYTVEGYIGYADFSDGNARWDVGIAPRRSVARTEKYNIDLGVSARWFGFDDELGNGYYDPATYQQYLVTAYSYYKLSDNSGVSLIVAPGVHKDESLDGFRFSGSVAIEGTFGVYDDWMLKTNAGFVNNIGQSSETYRGGELGLSLTRRF
ncbi:MAG: hypothetical protein COB14_09550 [Alphaproteobacteria bacterium]|nr:MAG: hypothetical protein COB14_09550 [Alphaproteobacteria bacterium]